MKYIITERQYKLLDEGVSLFIKRRMDDIDMFVDDALDETDPEDYNYDEYVDEIAWQVVDKFGGNLTPNQIDELMEYVIENYWNYIEEYHSSFNDEF
jgi:hypothetical protein